ncbi:mechanosensitive ion channel family protein [Paenibacillus ehimensis]|uniref:Mechanosensitive ion channel family protein n=1 Tax=Paenibacillus ehimensis TaxID=79264 RepID=A0ABT8VL02_9BACL|nr:mechanosensitive ion channel family protein [Paenibacillus ehimensis]MDO3681621.1 mechanosensitive ion channel family protein [Paenibacillus ehimensis]MEC0208237.1 mechanosensitive ion channel family protein [Paenibacillus ehimensis]
MNEMLEKNGLSTWGQFQEKLINYVSNPELWTGLLFTVIKIVLIYIAGRVIIKVAEKALQHMIMARDKGPIKFDARRSKTIGKLVGNIITYVVNFIMILMILSQFQVNLGPVLAGAGVVGLAIGFGAQSLVKDVITGFFIIFEDQFAVGDVIQVGNYKGTVEEIGLRVTRVKSWTGEVHIIPNGTIAQVTNFSINNSLAVIDVSVTYETDIDFAMKILEDTVKTFYDTSVDMVKEPEVLGIHMMGATEITLRITAECKPNQQFGVARKLNAEIKKAFEANGIQIPYPRMITYHRTEKAES